MYDRDDGALSVFVHDGLTGEELLVPVTGDEASEVYRHPYAYAHRALKRPTKEREPRRIRISGSA